MTSTLGVGGEEGLQGISSCVLGLWMQTKGQDLPLTLHSGQADEVKRKGSVQVGSCTRFLRRPQRGLTSAAQKVCRSQQPGKQQEKEQYRQARAELPVAYKEARLAAEQRSAKTQGCGQGLLVSRGISLDEKMF